MSPLGEYNQRQEAAHLWQRQDRFQPLPKNQLQHHQKGIHQAMSRFLLLITQPPFLQPVRCQYPTRGQVQGGHNDSPST